MEEQIRRGIRRDKVGGWEMGMARWRIWAGLLGASTFWTAIGRANLISNPGFESTSSLYYGGMANWKGYTVGPSTGTSSATVTRDVSSPFDGVADALLSASNAEADIGSLKSSTAFAQGVPYTLSFYSEAFYSQESIVNNGYAYISFYNNSGSQTGASLQFQIRPSGSYQEHSFSVLPSSIPSDAVSFIVQFQAEADYTSASLHVDDVSFDVPEPGAVALSLVIILSLRSRRAKQRHI